MVMGKWHIYIAILVVLFLGCGRRSKIIWRPSIDQIENFRSDSTICITKLQSGDTKDVGMPVIGLTSSLLEKYTHLEVLNQDATNCDLQLLIEIDGEGIWATYSTFESGRKPLCAGARIKGCVTLSSLGVLPYKIPFARKTLPPSNMKVMVHTYNKQTSLSTIEPVYWPPVENGLTGATLLMIGRIFGVDKVIKALEDEDEFVRGYAAFVLRYFDDPLAIPALIRALTHRDEVVSQRAAGSLEYISGKDFGLNQKKWRYWWSKNMSKYNK